MPSSRCRVGVENSVKNKKLRSNGLRVGGAFLIVLMAILAGASRDQIGKFPSGDSLYFLTIYLGGAVFGWLVGIRPLLLVDEVGIVVKNPLRTQSLRWADIRGFQARDAVVIELVDGRTVRFVAIQRTNLSKMLGRRSFVDDVVDDLEKIRLRHLGDQPPEAEETRE